MIHRLHPTQLSNRPLPRRSGNGAGFGVKFGALTREQMDKYQPVFENIPELRNYSGRGFLDIFNGMLSEKEQDRLEKILAYVEPEQLETLVKEEKLGILKSASNMLLGLYTVTASRSGVISESLLTDLSKTLQFAKQDKKDFDQCIKELSDKLPAESVNRFQPLVGAKSGEEARKLLSLIVVRVILSSNPEDKNKKKLLQQDGQMLLTQGLQTFTGRLPWHSLRRLQLWLMVAAYKYIPKLSNEWFRGKLLELTKERIAMDELRYDDLMNILCQNERYSQNIIYKAPNLKEHRKSEAVLPLQMLYEAAIVKHARLWRPKGSILAALG
jgi:hypothetical protein